MDETTSETAMNVIVYVYVTFTFSAFLLKYKRAFYENWDAANDCIFGMQHHRRRPCAVKITIIITKMKAKSKMLKKNTLSHSHMHTETGKWQTGKEKRGMKLNALLHT